jgi:Hemerythrin HHE cation binding domain
MTNPAAAPPLSSGLLAAHHDDVERMCRGLLADTLADDPRQLVDAWRRFERAALEHMAAEEELVVPGYAVADPADAAAICEQHARLRELLGALGIEVELHVIRATTVRALTKAMRAHAAHEHAGMYRWAARHLAEPVRAALWTRLVHLFEDEAPAFEAPASPVQEPCVR